MSGRRPSPAGLAGLGAVALAVCCGLPALVSAGVLAGLTVWLVGGGLLVAAVVTIAVFVFATRSRRRVRRPDAPSVGKE